MALTKQTPGAGSRVLADMPRFPEKMFLKVNGQPDIEREARMNDWVRQCNEALLEKLEHLSKLIDGKQDKPTQ